MTSHFAWPARRSVSVVGLVLAAIIITVIPNAAAAQTEQNKTRLSFEINTVHEILTGKPLETPEVKIDPNIAVLQNYLEQKGSPLAPLAQHILKHDNWKLAVAIANGESTLCKRQMYNNCWGIGGAWNLRRYGSLADGFTDVNRLLTDKYVSLGADTPKEIVRKYVGNYSPTWIAAVSQTVAQLDQLPLQE